MRLRWSRGGSVPARCAYKADSEEWSWEAFGEDGLDGPVLGGVVGNIGEMGDIRDSEGMGGPEEQRLGLDGRFRRVCVLRIEGVASAWLLTSSTTTTLFGFSCTTTFEVSQNRYLMSQKRPTSTKK